MTTPIATMTDLVAAFDTLPAELPVTFRTGDGALGKGTHVTEVKLARIESVDCSAQRHHWTEAHVQLLDFGLGRPLTAGKTKAILSTCVQALPDLAGAPVLAEGSLRNQGLSRLSLALDRVDATQAIIALAPMTAACKAAPVSSGSKTDCCG